ncbi:MAG: hypothetical protein JNK47_03335 [Mesorhizobium sp.]|nr:hypothetical protein [Mesorhizobium sp.]
MLGGDWDAMRHFFTNTLAALALNLACAPASYAQISNEGQRLVEICSIRPPNMVEVQSYIDRLKGDGLSAADSDAVLTDWTVALGVASQDVSDAATRRGLADCIRVIAAAVVDQEQQEQIMQVAAAVALGEDLPQTAASAA